MITLVADNVTFQAHTRSVGVKSNQIITGGSHVWKQKHILQSI